MIDFAKFVILGLGTGSVYAIVALGLVLVYRGSGVVNFSQGALALTGSALFFELRDPLPDGLAVVVATLAVAVIGTLIQILIMGPMRASSPLARLIVTLGLLAVGLEIWDRRFPRTIPAEQFLPDSSVDMGNGLIIPESRIYLFVIAILLGAGLWALYRFTRFGLATTAVAENENVASANGWSPNFVATVNWAIGGALAGFGGSLLFGLLGINPVSHVLVVIPALAAALLGGFRSFPLTVAAGLALGVADSLALLYVNEDGITKGLRQAIPFLLIVFVLVVRGRALPLRSFAADRLPLLGSGRVRPSLVLLVGSFAIVSLHIFGVSWTKSLVIATYYGIICLSLVVLVGFAGQLSLAQWAVAGMGALFAGRVAADLWDLPMWLALVIGVVFTVPVGLLISLPALRVRGVNLAIVTLGLAVVIDAMILTNTTYTQDGFVPAVVPDPTIFGIEIAQRQHPTRFATFGIVLFVICTLIVANLRRGQAGRRMIAVRGNENAAASLGISVVGVKAYAFSVAAGLAALGGGVIAFASPNLVFDTSFPRLRNIDVVLLAVIGGIGHIGGTMIGGLAALGGGFERIVAQVIDPRGWWQLIAAVLLVLIVIFRPDGGGAGVVNEFRHAGARRKRAFLIVGSVFTATSLVTVHSEWTASGITGVQINEGQLARGLLVVAVVAAIAGFRYSHMVRLQTWLATVSAACAIAVVLATTTVATPELAFDGTWKWTVAGAVYAFIFYAYVAVRGFTKTEAAEAAQSLMQANASSRSHAARTTEIARVDPKVLSLRDVSVSFGAVRALVDASLDVHPGEVVGLIGPNGAGKTTLIEATTGFVSATGRITVDGQDISALSATQRSRLGLARSFQSLELFEDMSVLDNLRTAVDAGGVAPYFADLIYPRDPGLSAAAQAAIDEFELGHVLDKRPSELPYAMRRAVAIARALSVSPSVILLDEPAAGLDSTTTAELEVLIRRLASDWGMAVLLIEHDVALVMRTCDRIVALDFGKIIDTGTPAEIAKSPAVIAAYLGESDTAPSEESDQAAVIESATS